MWNPFSSSDPDDALTTRYKAARTRVEDVISAALAAKWYDLTGISYLWNLGPEVEAAQPFYDEYNTIVATWESAVDQHDDAFRGAAADAMERLAARSQKALIRDDGTPVASLSATIDDTVDAVEDLIPSASVFGFSLVLVALAVGAVVVVYGLGPLRVRP